MTGRLQVLLPDDQYEALRHLAAIEGVTVAAWVRRMLDEACRERPYDTVEAKLSAVREAAAYEFPTADVERMLAEIDAGRGAGGAP